jgi:trans-2,3-dihydro-3-hydroxyanthranilate isomerase
LCIHSPLRGAAFATFFLWFTGTVPTFRYVVADVFTDVPLAGNQVAVFTDARAIPEEMLQPLAREMKLSETVFVYPPSAEGNVRVRIFTPTLELPFAGHPILGTAFVLAGPLQLVEIRLECDAGVVPVRIERDGSRIVFGWMTQPPFAHEPYADADALLALLGIDAAGSPVELYRQGPQHVVVELASPEAVVALRPDFGALEALSPYGTACVARDGDAWKARVFVPAHGVPEDPATGSAAGPIALHLARHGRIEFGEEIQIRQGVEIDRPSTLYAVARSETEIEVGGSAVVVARGEFRLP